MLRTATAGLLCFALIPAAYAAPNCAGSAVSQPLPLPATVIAPAAAEFYTRSVQLGMPTGVLAQPSGGEQSVDRVLLRLRVEGCQDVAKVIPPGGTVNPNDPAAYKATTAFDNTPWRFDMSQNGKRMTAEEFDAWMKARGVRVVKARPAPGAPAPAVAPAAPAADAKPVENK
ncbi:MULTISPECIES: hypothetical protein [Xanthomonas]|uniref:Secreted protein n=1 Tax=Xanthomonas cucurbitae TaxID=56453 RepID=A0A2S7DP08_9XANT|nr:hypothetical protein [Xanthomonas cucurbitae]PPU75595.1 hypothetical protein XcuCFBP2542_13620 [Xanthomonas cucurbitae]QHG86277.1 hypothetical protein EBN15_03980 [Xanthomonas cucurbitae]WDM68526.1 hypothetical protein K6981_04200 [Xanthomonas cucurbitae]WDM72400.1 hypothetical protein K6978_04205 [Xanthomonas cucurbitae]WDM76195.1 hypothetical protein K6982_03950 [Xanthomonas cucurbitae]